MNSNLIQIYLGLTSSCNLKCPHCFVQQSISSEINFHLLDLLFKESAELGVMRLVLGQGEPLLYCDLDRTVKLANKNDLSVKIMTNAQLLSSTRAESLNRMGVYHFALSLDFPVASLQDKFRACQGYFDHVIGISSDLLKKGIFISFSVAIGNHNYSHIVEIYNLAKQIGVSQISFIPCRPGQHKILHLNYEILEQVLLELLRLRRMSKSIEVTFHDPLSFRVLWDMCSKKEKEWMIGQNRCFAGECSLAISSNGTISTCTFSEEEVGSIYTHTLKEIWERIHEDKKRKNTSPRSCIKCRFLENCYGGCKSFRNSNKSKDFRCPGAKL